MDLLETLAKNNDAPSDAVVKEVNGILEKPLQDLHDLEIEIQRFEERLEELKAKRTEVQQRIAPYQSILAPIRRLPTDMLGEIFQYCLPTHRNPIMMTDECPLLLTQICIRWRAVAIADSRLWSRLYITFSDDDMVPVGLTDGLTEAGTPMLSYRSKQRAMHILRTRIEAVKQWLSRSKSRPLSISLTLTCNLPRPQSNPYADEDMTLELLQFLVSVSPRFQHLELNIPFRIYRFLENMISIPEMKVLKSFKTIYQYRDSQFSNNEDWNVPIGLLNAPSLRKISLGGGVFSLWKSVEATQNWSKVTHVAYHQQLRVSDLVYFLERSLNLVFFDAAIGPDSSGSIGPSLHPQISLPFLRCLHINDDLPPSSTSSSELYNAIDAPSLQCFVFRSPPFLTLNVEQDISQLLFMPLISKSRALKKLTLDVPWIPSWGIERLFRVAPTITHLVVGATRYPRVYRSSRPRRVRNIPFTTTLWDLGGLLVNPASVEDAPLLPNLESLSVSSTGAYFSDEVLKNFIIRRLDPSSPHGLTPLKHVGITFNREKEMDTEAYIRRHAQSVGLDIDLDFEYCDPLHDLVARTFSPSYGLGKPHTLHYDHDVDDADGFLTTSWPSY